MSILMLATVVGVPQRTKAEESDDNGTEYVLILSNTRAQHDNDPMNNRAAAAKLFVDMLPADNARLTIFVIGNKDTGAGLIWGQGNNKYKYGEVHSYELGMNKDGIFEEYSHDRMFCVYQIVISEKDLTPKNREDIKAKIDWIYSDMPVTDAFNDLHCAVYASMDYLATNHIKNACILMISDEATADHTGFPRAGGQPEGDFYWAISNYSDPATGANPEGDNSFVNWIKNENRRIRNENKGEIPYNWSFNWLDLTQPKDRVSTKAFMFFTDLCASNQIGGEFYQVDQPAAYSSLPAWTVSILQKYTGNVTPETVPVRNGECTFELPTVYSEVNIAITGSSLDEVTIEFTPEDGTQPPKSITFTSDNSGITKTIVDKDDVWFTCETDTHNKNDPNRFMYSNIKLILPNPGKWHLTFKGKNTGDITVQIVKAQDAELRLTTEKTGTKGADGVFRNVFDNKQPVVFRATFWYNGRQIRNTNYLKNNIPYTRLYYRDVNGNQPVTVEPQIGNGDLVYTFTPPRSGTFHFYTLIEASEYFSAMRNGDCEYEFTFSNNLPRLKDGQPAEIPETCKPDTDMYFGDYLRCFTDDDGEDGGLTIYQLTVVDFENDKNEKPADLGNYTFHIPNTRGEYTFSIRVNDPEGGISTDELIIRVHVKNDAPVLLDPDKNGEEVRLIAGIPDFLIRMGIFTEEDRTCTVYFDKFFTDPDGDALVYAYQVEHNQNDTNSGAIAAVTAGTDEAGREQLVITPVEGAEMPLTVTVTASDHTDAVSPAYTVTVHVDKLLSVLLARYWWVLALLALIILIIIILRASRRVHGHWKINIVNLQNQESCYHSFPSLAATKNSELRRTAVYVKSICNAAIRMAGADTARLNTTEMNNKDAILHGTVLPGKCKLEFKVKKNLKVSVNGKEKLKGGTVKIRQKQVIELNYFDENDIATMTITLSFT